MTSQESRSFTCRPGYWLRNIANVDETPDWREEVMPLPANNRLFGYEEAGFLAKQYKPSR